MSKQEHSDLSVYPAIDISYKSAKEHYSGQVAAIMDKLSQSKTAARAKAMQPHEFKWSLVFNRAGDPPSTLTDPKMFTSYLCANSQCWLKARGGGWKGYEPIEVTPPQIRNQYEQRANLICQQRKVAAAGETEHESNCQDQRKSLADELLESFRKFTDQGGDYRLVSVAKSALEMLIEDVLE